jgi:carbonic anhydrase/acetyltransferase-like protein (isoleucine patch superfamily)
LALLRSYRGVSPRVAANAYVDASAQVIGDVEIGELSSVWMNAVLRGDVHFIRIGRETNIQDGSVLHGMRGRFPVILGDRVTVGHNATLHGCVVEDDCLIGMGAVVLNGARVGRGSMVGAGALVTERSEVPANSLFLGAPASFRKTLGEADLETIRAYAARYVEYRADYLESK